VSGLSLIGLAGIAATTIYIAANQLAGNITRIPNVFSGLAPAGRPAVPAAYRQSMTIMVVGSDSRSAALPGEAGPTSQQQADAIMLVHIDASRRAVSVISIPRNSWIRVPGLGMMSFYKVLSLGGPTLMIKTVEHLTGVRIDHYAAIDFAGLRNVVQALGGVQVAVARQTRRGGVTFHHGLNELSPSAAMVYVSTAARAAGCRCWQLNGLPGGDLSRVQRQQNLIRAILAKSASLPLLSDPIAWYRLLDAFSRTVSVDSTFTNAQLRSLALRLARMHGGDFTFLTVPVRGLGWQARDGVVYLNVAQCATLWDAVRHDSVAAWAVRHPAALTPQVSY
jgi:LCP family protein required for cell wall assembly